MSSARREGMACLHTVGKSGLKGLSELKSGHCDVDLLVFDFPFISLTQVLRIEDKTMFTCLQAIRCTVHVHFNKCFERVALSLNGFADFRS